VIGPGTFTPAGRATVKVACNEPAGDTCAGTVLVVTRQNFQTVAGGPFGQLVVFFAPVKVDGGSVYSLTSRMLPAVASALRHHSRVPVTIIAALRPNRGKAIRATVREVLRRR
jgi:hypothetical protein